MLDQEEFAAAQARWLAMLAEALGDAERLTRLLAKTPERAIAASAVLQRLTGLQAEVDALQRRASKGQRWSDQVRDRTR